MWPSRLIGRAATAFRASAEDHLGQLAHGQGWMLVVWVAPITSVPSISRCSCSAASSGRAWPIASSSRTSRARMPPPVRLGLGMSRMVVSANARSIARYRQPRKSASETSSSSRSNSPRSRLGAVSPASAVSYHSRSSRWRGEGPPPPGRPCRRSARRATCGRRSPPSAARRRRRRRPRVEELLRRVEQSLPRSRGVSAHLVPRLDGRPISLYGRSRPIGLLSRRLHMTTHQRPPPASTTPSGAATPRRWPPSSMTTA